MSWTDVIIVASIWLFAGAIGFVWTKYVYPWLTEHHLNEAAVVAVNAAEALFGRYHGEEKLKAALELLDMRGWNVNSDLVLNAIRAAWTKLNLAQIEAGVKEPEAEKIKE